jgi:lambda family phage portal protein
MGVVDWFKRAPASTKKRNYAAANTGRLFSDFVGSTRSSDAELRPALSRIRARSRDLSRNNEYARRYLDLLGTNVVGDGVKLQVKALDSVGRLDTGNNAVEAAFRRWGQVGNCTVDGRLSWVDVQRLTIESVARDGEAFLILHRGAGLRRDSFAIELIEPDQIDEDLNRAASDGKNQIRMGVELDRMRRPVAYHIKTAHPGDSDIVTPIRSKTQRIPADRVIHVYRQLRAGQTRGEPWMASALSSLKMLDGLREAAIVNARVGASKMGFFTSSNGDGYLADENDGNVPIMDAEPGSFTQLPAGVGFEAWDPQFPSTDIGSFQTSILRGIASGLGVTYNALNNDLESTSYSSIRQGALEERDMYRGVQAFLIDHMVRPVYLAWLGAAMELNSFGIPLRQFDRFADASMFRGRTWSWVDPLKESQALIQGMQAGIQSLDDAASHYGRDSEDLLAQIARDRDLAAQFGITYALQPFGVQKMPVDADGVDGDEE